MQLFKHLAGGTIDIFTVSESHKVSKIKINTTKFMTLAEIFKYIPICPKRRFIFRNTEDIIL